MPIMTELQRSRELRRLCLTEPLIQQATGEQLHPYFWYRCLGPPQFVDQGVLAADGARLYPLWQCGEDVAAVWQRGARRQFIEFNIKSPGKFAVLATTEQGLWATVFDRLHEDYITLQREDFVVPAAIVGFRFLDELWTEYERTSHGTADLHQKFLLELVTRIDALAAGEASSSD